MKVFRDALAEAIGEASGLDLAEVAALITTPPEADWGDYAVPCFVLAKKLKKSPNLIAEDIAGSLKLPADLFTHAEAKGPYVNAHINGEALAQNVLTEMFEKGENFGNSDFGGGKNVVIDYSSPNLAKPFGIPHIRSTVIGGALYRLFAARGYTSVGINHVGDWGTQFGLLAVAWQKWGDEDKLAKDGIQHSYDLYVKVNQEAKDDPTIREEGRALFKKMEEGDNQALGILEKFRHVSIEYYKKIYGILGVEFDSWSGEAFYNDKMAATIERMREKGLLVESEGAHVVPLEDVGIEAPAIVLKSDGATTYLTRDVCAAEFRASTYDPAYMMYVVDYAQSLHFKQVYAVLKKMGYAWADQCVHVDFGRIQGMSTREGTIVFLEDVLNEAMERARGAISEKNPELDAAEEVARSVGVGAVIFNDLKQYRHKDVVFDIERAVSFEGETGPYLQNAHVRTCGILRKWDKPEPVMSDINVSLLGEPHTRVLLKLVGNYPHAVARACDDFEPSTVSRYLLDIASAFHSFYHEHQVIGDDFDLSSARIALVLAVKQVLAHGLRILGLDPLERM